MRANVLSEVPKVETVFLFVFWGGQNETCSEHVVIKTLHIKSITPKQTKNKQLEQKYNTNEKKGWNISHLWYIAKLVPNFVSSQLKPEAP